MPRTAIFDPLGRGSDPLEDSRPELNPGERDVIGPRAPPSHVLCFSSMNLSISTKILEYFCRGYPGDGFDAELSSYGKKGRVLGPVVGAFGELSDGVNVIAEAVADDIATENRGAW